MGNKKGLSEVVTTLIIVLLAIVAVTIVWIVVSNIIHQGAQDVSLNKISFSLTIMSAYINGGNISVGVQRSTGQGDMTGIRFTFYNGKNSTIIDRNVSLGQQQQKTFTFNSSEIGNANTIQSVSVAPFFTSSSGKISVGEVMDTKDVGPGKNTPSQSSTNPPSLSSVTLDAPVDGSVLSNGWIEFNATIKNFPSLSKVNLWGNWGGAWAIGATNNTPVNNAQTNLKLWIWYGGPSASSTYAWNIQACDASNNCIFAPSNKTFTLKAPPSVILNAPADGATIPLYNTVDFNFTVNNYPNLNVTILFGNFTGSGWTWELFNWTPINNVQTVEGFSGISSGTYAWTVAACSSLYGVNGGTSTNCTYAPLNRTFTVS